MLVGADAGRVDRHIFCVRIERQSAENTSKNATFAPSSEALVRRLPVAVAIWQIAPGNAGSVTIDDGIDEQPVVRRISEASGWSPAVPSRSQATATGSQEPSPSRLYSGYSDDFGRLGQLRKSLILLAHRARFEPTTPRFVDSPFTANHRMQWGALARSRI